MANIRKLSSGKYQVRVHKDGKLVSIGTFRTSREAEIAAGKAEERKDLGQNITNKNTPFEFVVEEWLKWKKQSTKPSTFRQLEVIIRNHVMPAFGHKKIAKITRIEIKDWLATFGELDRNGKPKYSIGSRRKYLSVIKSILFYAVQELRVLGDNPADRLKIEVQDNVALKKEDKKVKYFSLDEMNQLLDYLKTYKHQRFSEYQMYYMLIFFLYKTGLRISEALALRWENIEGNMVDINKQTSRDDNNKVILTTLKNDCSYRTIQIEDEVLRELKKFKAKQNELILGNPRFRKNKDGIIFQNYNGHYLTPSIIRETIQNYHQASGVEYRGLHAFRHTHATLLLESGVSEIYVAKRLGHKDTKELSRTYGHITNKIQTDELAKFSAYTSR
ncbi:tyrosine-type recombinase/integrase [Brevibacillus halotolerans]|uniref:tyrosine-type recombinase/integrase n=2 Tax=Bacillales TaxID=1385 RepID=UPI0015EF308F|nr:site-specific integrase [Brevibacillus halotolerans]MBA4532559.1 site-specific integrase [Brevibacillus halotolerans]